MSKNTNERDSIEDEAKRQRTSEHNHEKPGVLQDIGIRVPELLLPASNVDPKKWAVIACDQYTSEPEYWNRVEELVGDAPSTLRIMLPEVFLEKPGEAERIQAIQQTMKNYLNQGVLVPHNGFVYVERTIEHSRVRRGIVVTLDLEHYDYSKQSKSLIRATEGTIVERLPPRIKVRTNASIELPHILVLIDDPSQTVIEPIASFKQHMEKLYDVELMQNGGHLTGYAVPNTKAAEIIENLRLLTDRESYKAKYALENVDSILLFAMGDGNHSLATAKAVWESNKAKFGMDHPSRFALVEIENVHDPALIFEPIHRVVFDIQVNFDEKLREFFGDHATIRTVQSFEEMAKIVEHNQQAQLHSIGLIENNSFKVLQVQSPKFNLPVGTIQEFLDKLMREKQAQKIDYVHGSASVLKLAQGSNVGVYLPKMEKSDLFKTVILDGALPRKTFSMGEADEKRFYFEARRIGLE